MGRTVTFAVVFGHKQIVSLSNTNEGGSAIVGGDGGMNVPSLTSNLRCSFPDIISTLYGPAEKASDT